MKKLSLLIVLTVLSSQALANQVFYRYGSANIDTSREGSVFTDVGGANGLNNDDIGASIGAGLDLKLMDCFLFKGNELFGQIFVNYTKFSEEQVANAGNIFLGVGIGALITAVIIFLFANKLVEWMHGAEGEESHDLEGKIEEEIAVTADHEGISKN